MDNNLPNEEVISKEVDVKSTAKRVHFERENNKKTRILIFTILLLFLVLIAAFVMFSFYRKQNVYKFDSYKLYQYFTGIKVEYDGKVTITSDGDIVKISNNEGVENVEGLPIYFQEENQVFFAKNMHLVIPRIQTKSYRINYFSKISVDIDEVQNIANLNYKNKNIYLEESFIYDGDNLYLFPYGTTVNIDGKDYKLSPLSYIIVNYKDQIEFYDKESDKYTIIETHDKDVIANVATFNINLSTDTILYNSGNRLLIKSVDNMPLYEGSVTETKNQK